MRWDVCLCEDHLALGAVILLVPVPEVILDVPDMHIPLIASFRIPHRIPLEKGASKMG
jgi:hypothetical protein